MSHTDFLIAMPSFIRGAGRLGDLLAATRYYSYNQSATPDEADARAIAHDWAQVGEDLHDALRQAQPESSKA